MVAPLFTLVQCMACGHVYSDRVLVETVLAHEYYCEHDGDLAARSMASKQDRLDEYMAMLAHHGVSSGRVLDVGCNSGDLLYLFRKRGWTVAGVEPSPGPAHYARTQRSIQVWTGTIEDLPKHEGFDLVTLTHVLEHIADPRPVLARVRRALSPGGHVLIEVPNVADPCLSLWGRHYRPLCLGDHVSFFSAKSLRTLVERCSFTVVDEASPTHARDLVYANLLSAVDAARSLRHPKPAARNEPVGVETQMRYRGALRTPVRRALDALTRSLDPAVVFATRGLSRANRGSCLIVLARPA